MTGRRWGDFDPNQRGALSTTQALANASLAVGSTAPTLLGTGIGLLLPPARSR